MQAMHGHLIPVDVVLNDESGSTSRAYLVYQKLVVLRHAMVVTLLLLPFFEVSCWLSTHSVQPSLMVSPMQQLTHLQRNEEKAQHLALLLLA